MSTTIRISGLTADGRPRSWRSAAHTKPQSYCDELWQGARGGRKLWVWQRIPDGVDMPIPDGPEAFYAHLAAMFRKGQYFDEVNATLEAIHTWCCTANIPFNADDFSLAGDPAPVPGPRKPEPGLPAESNTLYPKKPFDPLEGWRATLIACGDPR